MVMKRISFLLLMISAVIAVEAQQMYVATYNIRYKNDGDAKNGDVWERRCKVIADQIIFEDPDIFGTQEMLIEQIRDFESLLPEYGHIGKARDDGKEAGEHSAIFYHKDRVELIENGDFWLSESPDIPSKGWDAACVRICTWGKFMDKRNGKDFFFFNLHMDHVGKVARREAARLVVRKIEEIAGLQANVILTGDFNVDQNDEIYGIFIESGLLNDSYTVARKRFAENGTFNAFNSELKTDSRIDHVFVSPQYNVERYGVLTNCYWTENKQSKKKRKAFDAPQEIDFSQFTRRTPSDHYPVFVKLTWQ